MEPKVGQKVRRWISSARIPMDLVVTAVDERFIHCGDWKFDKTFGYEVDEDLGWGEKGPDGIVHTGSVLELKN